MKNIIKIKFIFFLFTIISQVSFGQLFIDNNFISSQETSLYGGVDFASIKANRRNGLNSLFAELKNNNTASTSDVDDRRPRSLKNYYFIALTIENTGAFFPKISWLIIKKDSFVGSKTYATKKTISDEPYSYITYFYIGSSFSSAKYSIIEDVPGDYFGENLLENSYTYDFVENNVLKNERITLNPYFDGVLESLTIIGN